MAIPHSDGRPRLGIFWRFFCRRSRRPAELLLSLGLVAATTAEPLPTLTTAADVRNLTVTEAKNERPVVIEGVVLTFSERVSAFVVADETDGVFVLWSDVVNNRLQSGDRVEVRGRTAPGDFAPIVRAEQVRRIGAAVLPPPLRTTLAEVAAGGFDAKWVEVEGIVRQAWVDNSSANPNHGATVMVLAWADTVLRLRVQARLEVATLVDARVRVKAVCFNLHNSYRQFVRASLQADRADAVTVLAKPQFDPYALPLRRAGELLQFSPAGFNGHRVRVRGMVIHQQERDALWIRDGDRGLRVVSEQADEVRPGEIIDVVGFVDRGGYSPSMGDAVFRRVGGGEPATPIKVDSMEQAILHEADLIEIEAPVRALQLEPGRTRLQLDWNNATIEAVLDEEKLPGLVAGSRVRVAGICMVQPGSMRVESGLWEANTFQILLRSVDDLEVVANAPWWEPERLNRLLACSAVALFGALIVSVVAWRRQVLRRETARQMAETEFTAILGERNRMARDIHDSLAQGLNAVSMHLELARNTAGQGGTAMLSHVATAHGVVRSCLARARESIWNMRSQVLERFDLPGALGDVLHQMSAGMPVQTEVVVTGLRRRLAPRLENDLLQIGQEAISNVLQHAAARRIEVRLDFGAQRLRLSVIDDGRGFDATKTSPRAGHFGLAGIRERAEKMHARLKIDSQLGRGTTVRVDVDAPGGEATADVPA